MYYKEILERIMDARNSDIFRILNGSKQFLIPVYQRLYSWEIPQCKRLWNDIVEMQKKNKPDHFVGSIVNVAEQAMPTGVQKYLIIDGQQRLTTLTLLLIALRDYASDHEDNSINIQKINGTLLKNEYEKGDDRYKLILTETDKDVLIDLVERKPISPSIKSRLLDNYHFFYDRISELQISLSEVYDSFGKLEIVNITLERAHDDAQAIFESLNSTGKELSESDLIRNHILMGEDQSTQTYLYEQYWHPMEELFDYEKQDTTMDAFFRHYLTMKMNRIPKQGNVYEEFKYYHVKCEFKTVEELCKDLFEYSKYFTDVVFTRSDDKELNNIYKDINDLRMEVAHPFLLKVRHDFHDGVISESDFKEILKLCISYVLRRAICNIPTNSLNKTFATFAKYIKKDDYLNSVKAFFVLQETYKEFPNDNEFSSAFVSRDIYNMKIRNFILLHLENYENKAPIELGNRTIEHIMPQNNKLSDSWQTMLGSDWIEVQKKYLHTIGNLTLTGYNSEMSDKSFMEKMDMKGGFKESALRLNEDVINQTEWNEEKIKYRADKLARKAEMIWSFPKISNSDLARYKVEEKTATTYSLDSYDVNGYNKMLFNALDEKIMQLSPDVKREFKKQYVAYKLDTNFADVVLQKDRLRISINMKFLDIYDPNGLCKDITDLGRWGNGDAELFLEHMPELDQVMEIIKQSFVSQND